MGCDQVQHFQMRNFTLSLHLKIAQDIYKAVECKSIIRLTLTGNSLWSLRVLVAPPLERSFLPEALETRKRNVFVSIMFPRI